MHSVLPLYAPGVAESYPLEYKDEDAGAEKEVSSDQCDPDECLERCHTIIACYVVFAILIVFTRQITFPILVWAVKIYCQILVAFIRSLVLFVTAIKAVFLP